MTDGETPSAISLSFIEVWRKVQAHYPELKKQAARAGEASARKAQAAAGWWPRVIGGLGMSRTDDPVGVFSAKLKQESFTEQDFIINRLNHPQPRSGYSASVRVEMPLFDAFQTIGAIRTSHHDLQSALDRKIFIEMEASLLAVDGFLEGLLAQRLQEIGRAMERASNEDLRDAVGLMEKGLVLGADFYLGRAGFARIRQSNHSFVARNRVARSALNILQGDDPEKVIALSGRLPQRTEDLKPVVQWLEDAMQHRGDLAALRSSIQAQESEVEREKSARLPRVGAFAEAQENTHDFGRAGGNYTVGVQGTIDLFDPAYEAKVKKTKARLEQLRQDEAALKDSISRTVTEALAQYKTAHADLPVAVQAADDARKAVELMRALYRNGRKSIADLMGARQTALEAEMIHEELLGRASASRARLLFLAGKLDETEVREIARRIEGDKP